MGQVDTQVSMYYPQQMTTGSLDRSRVVSNAVQLQNELLLSDILSAVAP